MKSILFTVVARGTTILCKHAACAGNFAEVTEQILAKIGPEDSKLTYSHMSYLFHYVKEDNVAYLCITDDVRRFSDDPRSVFLNGFIHFAGFRESESLPVLARY